MCNNHLATLVWAISLGVRNLVFSSIVWTCDVPGKCFLGVKEVLEILLKVDFLPECFDYQPVHSRKYLCGCLTELEMYQIHVCIR